MHDDSDENGTKVNSKYSNFDEALQMCVTELKRGLNQLGFTSRSTLSDMELAAVGIAYNTGRYNPRKALRQGYLDGKRYYGENLFDYIRLAHTVASAGAESLLTKPTAGLSIMSPPTEITASGAFFRVDTRESVLRIRSAPQKSDPPQANVIGNLPDGHIVRSLTDTVTNGFREVQTSLNRALLHGFVANEYLVADESVQNITIVIPDKNPPASGIVAVYMPRKPGKVTRRVDLAGAHSLNEPGQPERHGESAEVLRAELVAIIDWPAVESSDHKRYKPRDKLTFCNIYCHDYCFLSGVYLPRVWWSDKALIMLSQGKEVAPLIGSNLYEMRANDFFRWLRDFGAEFGWRQTGTLNKLQQVANQGGVAIIFARRKEEGKSGHIVVAPETAERGAKRDALGEVVAPLQSQAGENNFRFGTGKINGWNGEQFAESAFWIHP